MSILISDIREREHSLSRELLLNTEAVLIAGGILVVFRIQLCDVIHGYRQRCSTDRGVGLVHTDVRIGERNVAQRYGSAEQVVASGLIHIVALNAFEHDAEATAQHT